MIKNWIKFNEDRTGWKGSDFKTDNETISVENFKTLLQQLVEQADGEVQILNDNFYDEYAGPSAEVMINGKKYEIYGAGDDNLWIKNYPIDNSPEGLEAGFRGTVDEICDVLTPPTSFPQMTLH